MAWLYSKFKTKTGISKHLVTTLPHTLHANYSVIEIYIQLALRRSSPRLCEDVAEKAPCNALTATLWALIPAINKLVAEQGSNSSRTGNRVNIKCSRRGGVNHTALITIANTLPRMLPGKFIPCVNPHHWANYIWRIFRDKIIASARCAEETSVARRHVSRR